jgi:hypothetical protein
MNQPQLPSQQPPVASSELDMLTRLYREIGISAVAAALAVAESAPRQSRISAQKLIDDQRRVNLAA